MRRIWRILSVGTSRDNISYLELLWNKNVKNLDKDLIKAFQSHPLKMAPRFQAKWRSGSS